MKTARALGVAIVLTLLGAAPAHAYKLLSDHWPSRTVAYHNAAGRFGPQVHAAARAWNRSGARVRWREVPSSRAAVRISVKPGLGPAGLAIAGGGRGRILLTPKLRSYGLSKRDRDVTAVQIIAHEMGHIIGLDHEDGRCATMNSTNKALCGAAPRVWRYRCRVLEADDVRGAIRLFGGRVRKPGAAFCDAVARPAAPTGLAATIQPDGTLTLAVRAGSGTRRIRVLRGIGGACPKRADGAGASLVEERTAKPGATLGAADFPEVGRHCYAAVAIGRLERPSRIATLVVDYAPPVPPPPPPIAPVANFDYGIADETTRTVQFYDGAYDEDGSIVAWAWDFGDGSGGSDPNPSHVYAASGDWTVTLTVTDDSGATDTTTLVVTVPEPPPPDPG